MIYAVLISLSIGLVIGAISAIIAYECPKCDCNDNKKQLLKG